MRALVLSGGGVKGAYQCGVISALLATGKQDYDIFAGVSVGAINAAFLATAAKGPIPLRAAAVRLKDFWQGIQGSKDVWKHWFLIREVAGLAFKDALYNSSPLLELLQTHLPDQLFGERALRLGVTSYSTGDYRVITEEEKSLADWVMASAAFPGFLLPVRRDGDIWVDGGARIVTPIKAAIDAGADELDVILASPEEHIAKKTPVDNALGTRITGLTIALRAVDMLADTVFANDLKMARLYNKLVAAGGAPGKRLIKMRVFSPTKVELIPEDPLDFDPTVIKNLLQHGQDTAFPSRPYE